MTITLPQEVKTLLTILTDAGHEAFCVGGACLTKVEPTLQKYQCMSDNKKQHRYAICVTMGTYVFCQPSLEKGKARHSLVKITA